MPVLLVIGVVCIVVGSIIVHKNSVAYEKEVLASSMAKGEELFVRNGDADGVLTLGNTLLSEDKKTMAVEIKYDDEAHKELSSFGQNYNLYLIDTEDNEMEEAELAYGMFGTDGSGVLTIHKDEGFRNKAFMVFILDKGVITTTEELRSDTKMTDDEIESSISSQLAQMDDENNKDTEKDGSYMDDDTLPPTFVMRLNAHSSETAHRNWNNDREIVEDLFVDRNLKKIEEETEDIEKQIESGERTLKEMDERLKENPDDEIAADNKSEIENSLENLEKEQKNAEDNYEEISGSNIADDVLQPTQTDYDKFTVIDLDRVK